MSHIVYTVSATIRFPRKAQEWLDWLRDRHIADVIAAGADSAEIVKLDPISDSQPDTTYEIRYRFKDRGTFETYLGQHAPRLRREGLEKFPLEDGFKYHRSAGEVLS